MLRGCGLLHGSLNACLGGGWKAGFGEGALQTQRLTLSCNALIHNSHKHENTLLYSQTQHICKPTYTHDYNSMHAIHTYISHIIYCNETSSRLKLDLCKGQPECG